MRGWMLVGVVGWGLGVVGAGAQQAPKKSCAVQAAREWSEADRVLAEGKPEDAEALYRAMPASPERTAGMVRAEMGGHKLDEALALAAQESAAHPADAALLDLLGEVRFRRGEVTEAATAFNRSLGLDPCSARTRFDIGRYMNLNGLYASGQAQLEDAHKLAPHDPVILQAWQRTQRVPMTAAEEIAGLRRREENGSLTAEEKAALESTIKAIEAREKGDCQLTEPVTTAKVAMYGSNTTNNSGRGATSSGVDVYLDGKRRRFMVDTGASGLLLSQDAAKSLGLTPEAEIKTFGFGDKGPMGTYLAHVDSLRIGGMEFHNCMVRVLEAETLQWTDGLLGPDMFRSFVVTLDFPAAELRLSPLPQRPDEAVAAPTLGTSGDAAGGLTIAQAKKDRYVAPEMQDWERVFRSGHDLIFPTSIGNAPKKLFIMDTGAGQNLISREAAREVTHVTENGGGRVRGISGEVNHVAATDSLSITFARVRARIAEGMNAIDTTSFSRGTGVEISGFIGYPILRELVIQIDYRDNLVHISYTPHVEH